MTLFSKSKVTAAAALLASAVMTTASVAAPAMSPATTAGISKAAAPQVQQVRDYRGWGHRGGWRHHGGRGWGWGLGGLAAGALLTAPLWAGGYDGYYDGYGPDYAYGGGGDVDRCEATFKSFDPASGTYLGYDGVRHMCPYL